MTRVTALQVDDIRFPTSAEGHGSDAMNPAPDYSAAYIRVLTDQPGLSGTSLVFTLGGGTDLQVHAVELLRSWVVGRPVDDLLPRLGELGRQLSADSHLRWLGPEKGVTHMAIGGLLNALWDMRARRAGQPLWRLLGRLTPEEIVDLVDFRHIRDQLSEQTALDLLRAAVPGRAEREQRLLDVGYPAYTTTPGWLGYSDDHMVRLAREAVDDGFTMIKMKVGLDVESDRRRLRLVRDAVGPNIRLAVDANQHWDVDEAIERVRGLAEFDLWWVEEPTSPDDVLGHAAIRAAVAPIRIATGEHAHNRVMVKQFLAHRAIDVLQVDACRLAGVNENVAACLLAAAAGVPVCPHAGGVGLCEMVQHIAMFDYVAVTGSQQGRVIEYVDHLHEHFVEPVVIERGHYRAPEAPGGGAALTDSARRHYAYPDGDAWQGRGAEAAPRR